MTKADIGREWAITIRDLYRALQTLMERPELGKEGIEADGEVWHSANDIVRHALSLPRLVTVRGNWRPAGYYGFTDKHPEADSYNLWLQLGCDADVCIEGELDGFLRPQTARLTLWFQDPSGKIVSEPWLGPCGEEATELWEAFYWFVDLFRYDDTPDTSDNNKVEA